jgi:hypothetical protein
MEQKRRALIWAATHARADAAERPSASGGSMQRSGGRRAALRGASAVGGQPAGQVGRALEVEQGGDTSNHHDFLALAETALMSLEKPRSGQRNSQVTANLAHQ